MHFPHEHEHQHDHDDPSPAPARGRPNRFDDDHDDHDSRHDDHDGHHERPRRWRTHRPLDQPDPEPPSGDRWSSWDTAEHGPQPRPAWLVTDSGAVDTELGRLKSGKEADVHLLERAVPGTGRSCLLAAKRYRPPEQRMFHRDAGYLEGRRVRRSRENRAMRTRTAFGRELIADQWAAAEFAALGRLWTAGAPVPYPAQRVGTELLLEFVGEPDGTAAPRLAQLRPAPGELTELWHQLTVALLVLAGEGLTHGDLSAFNVLVHRGRLVLIDLPQVVDVVTNPGGVEFLARDTRTICAWFAARGLPAALADPDRLLADLIARLW
ncbi:MAG: serine protein kinase RIO [Pseudonocardia sp.]